MQKSLSEINAILAARAKAIENGEPPPTIVLENHWTVSSNIQFVKEWLSMDSIWTPLRKLLFDVSLSILIIKLSIRYSMDFTPISHCPIFRFFLHIRAKQIVIVIAVATGAEITNCTQNWGCIYNIYSTDNGKSVQRHVFDNCDEYYF